ncbi:MAG TPA: peptide deformylase [Clostridiaceae bacterium]|jgi:peptide deformylase|nr:peptide deformylase [Clostridiaceae bacterium]HBN28442.1 peptide deformylase [Clostridiaceae bacterium]HBX48345.1 peptide deformylase [Clostridiaceae bacterium]HCL49801.1 peptide deformylase [Clostridiaceae bacterium]
MAVREIFKRGYPSLSKKSKRIDKIDKETLNLMQDLKDTLYSTETGIGLAAPQLGVNKRVIFVDLRDGIAKPMILINPVVAAKFGKVEGEEGCLSLPGYYGMVDRPRKVIVNGLNEKGEKISVRASGLLCRDLCHEIDHLEGIMFCDKAKSLYKESEE